MLLQHFSHGRAATSGRAFSTSGGSNNGVMGLMQPLRSSSSKRGVESTATPTLQATVVPVSERSRLVAPTQAALADPVTSTSSFSSMLDDDSDFDEQQDVIQVDMAEEDPSLKEDRQSGGKPARGRPPRAVVLAPTRELANQTANEFKTVCPGLNVVSVYGGTSISMQISDLRRGADVVVGTPGRVIDLIERGSLSLDRVRYAILDEADQMLDMGFEEDMEKILSYAPKERQTLLFSATLPKWINKVARRFQENPLLVDLVGEENTGRLADTIRLLVMQVEYNQKINALMDAITMHAANGKTIVFVNTKARANEVCDSVSQVHPAVALHGDISQAQRDRALQMFSVIDFFVPTADKLLASDQPARVLAASLAALAGFRAAPQPRSLLTYEEGLTTLRLLARPGFRAAPQPRSLLTYEVGLTALRLLARPGQIDGWKSLSRSLGMLLKTAKINKPIESTIGKIKVVEDSKAVSVFAAVHTWVARVGRVVAVVPAIILHTPLGCKEINISPECSLGATPRMVLDRLQSIALEVQGMIGGGGFDRSDRFGRGGSSSFGGSRGGSSYTSRGSSSGGSFSSSRGSALDRANSYSSSRGGGGSRGSYESERGGWGSRGASSGRSDRSERSERAYGGRPSGGKTREGKGSIAGSRAPSRGGSRGGSGSWSDDGGSNTFFDAADDGYFSGSSGGGGGWAQW
ncbi:P-loop containing nucleoside triphosphate hydrolase protein [Dunaliella salina]|uniref:P-loop containing nucleoside triphosphate hydrolase protein n=1 Tax=Dunaliella salina TaxID=3046 RepID=A0ABQ7G142_DUNSA|nr:P-loop containing nucleoside triphosphate hydrolase protein [Dunaliella salina]|eukprot:KAF5828318.1 P-loop containing nucleoside triphosphate hydrolase protein [Dunaliella salina]